MPDTLRFSDESSAASSKRIALRFDSRKLALTASLAGVYAIFRLTPLSRFIGLPGALTASGIAVPLLAVFLGPAYGVLAIFIGTLIAFISPANPVRFAGLDFLPGAVNLLLVSLAIRGRRTQASLLFLAVILSFAAMPYTTIFVGSDRWSPPLPYFWLHIVALLLLLSPVCRNLGSRLGSERYSDIATAVALVAFSGTMVEHLTGGLLFAFFLGPGASAFWRGIYLVYPIERAIMVAGAVVVCSPVLKNVRIIRESVILGRVRSILPVAKGITQKH